MTSQIYHGDCRDYLPQIVREASRPIIVTDPPFNVGYHYDEYADRMGEGEYYEMLADVFRLCPFVVIHYPEAIYRISFQVGKFPQRVVSWVYNSNTPRQHRDIAYFDVDPSFDGLGEYKNPTDRRIAARIAAGKKARGYDWLYCDQVKNVAKGASAHPCLMPLAVMLYVVGSLPEDATIIDPFAGGGYDAPCGEETAPKLRGVRSEREVLRRHKVAARRRLAAV